MMTDVKAAAIVNNVKAFAETIRAVKRIPSGHLYAAVMGKMSLDQYSAYIETIKGAGLVKEVNYELIWIGPDVAPKEEKKS